MVQITEVDVELKITPSESDILMLIETGDDDACCGSKRRKGLMDLRWDFFRSEIARTLGLETYQIQLRSFLMVENSLVVPFVVSTTGTVQGLSGILCVFCC